MKRVLQLLTLSLFLFASAQAANISTLRHEVTSVTGGDQGADSAACDFRSAMRKLWEDHITWTRLFIVASLDELPSLNATTARLLRNQRDIGDAIVPFYGAAAGQRLTELLTEHILIAAEIVKAAKAGDQTAVAEYQRRWTVNADQIALFLHEANPHQWSLAEMKAMMHEHLSLTTDEVVAHLEKRWDDDVRAYDKVHRQILGMADMLAFGIIAQFPGRF